MDLAGPTSFRDQHDGDSEITRMRTGERLAYLQACLTLFAYVGLSVVNHNWFSSLQYLFVGFAFAGLGYAVGRRHSAWAAALLIVLVVTEMVLGIISVARPLTLIIALFLWKYGQAFSAARKYARITAPAPARPRFPWDPG